MPTNHFLLLKKFKTTESAQLCDFCWNYTSANPKCPALQITASAQLAVPSSALSQRLRK